MSEGALRNWVPSFPKDGSKPKPEDMKAAVQTAIRNFAKRIKPKRARFGRRCPQGMWRRYVYSLHRE